MLHMDGANASTTFTDESGHTWTAAGNAEIKTAVSVFGGACGGVANTASFANKVYSLNHADYAIGAGDWEFDFRLRIASVTDNAFLVTHGRVAGNIGWFFVYQVSTNTLRYNYTSDGTNYLGPATFSWTPSNDTWYPIAITRNGANLRCFVDGTQIGSTYNIGATSIFGTTAALTLFSDTVTNATSTFFMDEFRFSVGNARWTGNFTVPAGPYQPAATIAHITGK